MPTTIGFETIIINGVPYLNITEIQSIGSLTISTSNNGDLVLLPNGTGITIVGDAGSDSHSLSANDDLFVSGKLEVDGAAYFDGTSIDISGATNPYFSITDTTSNAIVKCQATNTNGQIGTQSSHKLNFLTNNTSRGVIDANGLWGFGSATTPSAQIDLVVPDNGNVACMEIAQNDTTNNPNAIEIKNSGSGYTLQIKDSLDANVILADSSGSITAKNLKSTANAGAVNTGVTAVEYGDGYNHISVLTVSQADAVDIADNASIADGYLLYTFPAGVVVVDYAYMSMALQVASTEAQSDTPDVGLGTVIASGAVATLDGTATFENIITGQTAADSNGTATVKTALPTAGVPFIIESGDAHTIHFNIADAWADDTGGDLTGDISGTVVLAWRFLA